MSIGTVAFLISMVMVFTAIGLIVREIAKEARLDRLAWEYHVGALEYDGPERRGAGRVSR